ncbi:MAG TPA: TIGR03936 family radical SAM-associated protein [Lachnospiraceae bacterium]|nr:TIGR03936 family radical SAM-associated protein [Lachnospiraceae bacterium]
MEPVLINAVSAFRRNKKEKVEFMSYAVRIKFKRTGPVRYLGHLDMLRYFQKAVMRSGIDVKYSEGFNPHQIMSFAYPLGVSMETIGDYMDLELNSEPDARMIMNRMNDVMKEGICVVGVSVLPGTAINAMASVAAASYRIKLRGNMPSSVELDHFMQQEHIVIEKAAKACGKKGKHKDKQEEKPVEELDIKIGIMALSINENGELVTTLSSGSKMNLKPATLVEVMNRYLNLSLVIEKIIRTEIYRKLDDDTIVPLGEFDDQTKKES